MRLTSLDRVLWPAAGFTKRDLIRYYSAVAPVILPHLADRALTLGRWPDGVERPGFAQTECRGRPGWMRTARVRLRTGAVRAQCVVDDLASLLWIANQSALELHAPLHRLARPDAPTDIVFDLDPGPRSGLVECCRVAIATRDRLLDRGLDPFPRTSGATGLHVVVPWESDYAEARELGREVAAEVAAAVPDMVTDRRAHSERRGRVRIDWAQNHPGRTTIVSFSTRATDLPRVAAPATWRTVEAVLRSGDPGPLLFTPETIARSVDPHADQPT